MEMYAINETMHYRCTDIIYFWFNLTHLERPVYGTHVYVADQCGSSRLNAF